MKIIALAFRPGIEEKEIQAGLSPYLANIQIVLFVNSYFAI